MSIYKYIVCINTYLYKYNIIPICLNIYLYKYNIIIPIYINTYLWCRRNSTASNINFLLQRNHEFFNTLATWIHNRSCDRLFVGSRKLSMTNNFFDSGAQPLATTNLVLSKKKKKKKILSKPGRSIRSIFFRHRRLFSSLSFSFLHSTSSNISPPRFKGNGETDLSLILWKVL